MGKVSAQGGCTCQVYIGNHEYSQWRWLIYTHFSQLKMRKEVKHLFIVSILIIILRDVAVLISSSFCKNEC